MILANHLMLVSEQCEHFTIGLTFCTDSNPVFVFVDVSQSVAALRR